MQMVLPNIYMGSAIAAKNKQYLLNNGVTHILAIGWNLETHYPDTFKYLLINKIEDSPECIIISQFEQCFAFMDDCLNQQQQQQNILVHCHKGLSRSASIVIAYQMLKRRSTFDAVLADIRKQRSFIMPNIGFQAQLHEFQAQNYTLDMTAYAGFGVLNFIQQRLPRMLQRIQFNYNAYKTAPDSVNEDELFELTLYTHQVHKLRQKHKLNESDIRILAESIQVLRDIQVEFVQNESSIKRFDIMFKDTHRNSTGGAQKTRYEEVADTSPSNSLELSKTLAMRQTTEENKQNETTKQQTDGDGTFDDDVQRSESQKLIN